MCVVFEGRRCVQAKVSRPIRPIMAMAIDRVAAGTESLTERERESVCVLSRLEGVIGRSEKTRRFEVTTSRRVASSFLSSSSSLPPSLSPSVHYEE